jgi:hypothetical protein
MVIATTKLVTETVGVPVIAPVEVFNDKPAGSGEFVASARAKAAGELGDVVVIT